MSEKVSIEVLGEVIDEELDFDATTSRGLTNHLPMALVAKAGLGASRDELERFSAKYRQRLVPAGEPSVALTPDTWRAAIGHLDAYVDLTAYFTRVIDERGVEETVRGHLDDLAGGVSGAAFHGVIRLAYALDVASPARVATGLAYLAATAMTLGSLEEGSLDSDDPAHLLRELSSQWRGNPGGSTGNISARMRLVASQPQFASIAGSLCLDAATPERLAHVALCLYASTNDFTALHGVTGLEAISRLRPYVRNVERLDRATFQALAAAYLSIGAPELWSATRLSEMAGATTMDESEVSTRAAWSDDEHVAKIVFTSRRLKSITSEPLYLAVAERAVLGDTTASDPPHC